MIGQTFLDRYRIDSVLGQGATSDVFKAFDLTLERSVAIKLLTRNVSESDPAYERFLREAKLTSRLNHPNIVSIFDCGVLDGKQPFLVTEYLEGPTLQDLLDRDKLIECNRAILIFKQIAEGLSYAHAAGIVHRDVKPSNVVLVSNVNDADFVKIIDFGFLRVVAPGKDMQKLTQDDSVLGTAFYISPEQCTGKPANECSDVYSLGCLMYECISGSIPICGENLLETLQMHINSKPLFLSEVCDIALPEGLEALIMSCLEKKPRMRPQSMKQVVTALNRSFASDTAIMQQLASSGHLSSQELNCAGHQQQSSAHSEQSVTRKKDLKAGTLLLALGGLTLAGGLFFALSANSGVQKSAAKTDKNITTVDKPSVNPDTTTGTPTATAAPPKKDDKTDKSEEVDRLASLAQKCHSEGRCDEALQLLQRSVKLSTKVFGPNSKQTKERMKDLAVMYLTLDMQKEADQVMAQIAGKTSR